MTQITIRCDHSPRIRHPGVRSQVGLRQHHYEQSWWRWWNSSWAISIPTRWYCESAAPNMSANLENSAVATDWKRPVFTPIPKKGNAKECSNYCTIALISHASKSENKNEICSVVSDSLQPHGLYSPWNSPGQNTGVGSLSLLQGNLPSPGIEPRSPTFQVNSLPAEPQVKPKNTGVGSLSLLQQIFLTQELNQGLPLCRQILYQLSYQGSQLTEIEIVNFYFHLYNCYTSCSRKQKKE